MAYSQEPEPWMARTRYFSDIGDNLYFKAYATTEQCKQKIKEHYIYEKNYRYVRVIKNNVHHVFIIYARKT